jgi:hypothetical protein
MGNRSWEAGTVSAELSAVLPETLAEAEELAASIERAVQRETDYGVRDLCVEVSDDGVLLRGRCDSFYLKQLAQHAAMCTPGGNRLRNFIEVY